MQSRDIITENREYWSKRAATYSRDIKNKDLSEALYAAWSETVTGFLSAQFPGRDPDGIQALDIGTGPGFFAILLAEAGYSVTAIDLTPSMLAEARSNAGPLADSIRFLEMNAQELSFEDASFDVIVTRNLTWDLPDPELAYREWYRVLRPGGLLLNFDANWYRYLFDDEAKTAYDKDYHTRDEIGVPNDNPDVDYSDMEEIARQIPLSRTLRPGWDIEYLTSLGFRAAAHEDIWQKVWSKEEQAAYASTPLFLIQAEKD